MRPPVLPPPTEHKKRRKKRRQKSFLLGFLGFAFTAGVFLLLAAGVGRCICDLGRVQGSTQLRQFSRVRTAGNDPNPCQ